MLFNENISLVQLSNYLIYAIRAKYVIYGPDNRGDWGFFRGHINESYKHYTTRACDYQTVGELLGISKSVNENIAVKTQVTGRANCGEMAVACLGLFNRLKAKGKIPSEFVATQIIHTPKGGSSRFLFTLHHYLLEIKDMKTDETVYCDPWQIKIYEGNKEKIFNTLTDDMESYYQSDIAPSQCNKSFQMLSKFNFEEWVSSEIGQKNFSLELFNTLKYLELYAVNGSFKLLDKLYSWLMILNEKHENAKQEHPNEYFIQNQDLETFLIEIQPILSALKNMIDNGAEPIEVHREFLSLLKAYDIDLSEKIKNNYIRANYAYVHEITESQLEVESGLDNLNNSEHTSHTMNDLKMYRAFCKSIYKRNYVPEDTTEINAITNLQCVKLKSLFK